MKERQNLHLKKRKTGEEQVRLKQLDELIMSLPTETSKADDNAMDIIRRAAAALKLRETQ